MNKKTLTLLILSAVISQSALFTAPTFAATNNTTTIAVEDNSNNQIVSQNKEIKFLGLGDHEYANLNIDYDNNKITINTLPGKPHVYFKNTVYSQIDILNENGDIVYTKDFIGNKSYESETTEIPMKPGYKIVINSEEADRVRVLDTNNVQDTSCVIYKGETVLDITENGLKNKEENAKSREIQLLGLGDIKYADLRIDYDNNRILLNTFYGKPHEYFKGVAYGKIKVLDENGNAVYARSFNGDKELKNETLEIPMKPGYTINITSLEPNRVKIFNFNTNESRSCTAYDGVSRFIIRDTGLYQYVLEPLMLMNN